MFTHGRGFVRAMSSHVCKEVTFPVPWGVISGKEWTSESFDQTRDTHWLVLHGWLDNAGSFDGLAPLLTAASPRHSLLCVDYPGHGLSSHLPPGHMYHYLECLRYIKLVAKRRGWDKFGLIGHSMGAGMSSMFAATYPEMVEALVMIDIVKPVGRKTEDILEKTRQSIDLFFTIEDKIAKGEKVYSSEEEAFKRLQDGARREQGEGSVTDASARIMMKRGVKEVEGGVCFTRDLRHKVPSLYGVSEEMAFEFARNIKCPHLLIKASDSPNYESDEVINKALDIYRTNPKFDFVTVPGSHHVHLNNPERVAPHINQFLGKNFL